jgi:hypothetical protein
MYPEDLRGLCRQHIHPHQYRRQHITTATKAAHAMHLHSGAELFGNIIVPYSELTSKYHIGA